MISIWTIKGSWVCFNRDKLGVLAGTKIAFKEEAPLEPQKRVGFFYKQAAPPELMMMRLSDSGGVPCL